MRALATVAALTVVMSGSVDAQVPINGVPVLFGVVRQIEPSPSPDAWVIQVIGRGGIDGSGTGHFAITSDGSLTRIRSREISRLGAETVVPIDVLHSLDQQIRAALPQWKAEPQLTICSDCVATLLVLTRRESDGRLRHFIAYWDVISIGRVPADVRQIYDRALTLQGNVGRPE